jgi:hypothetical protein
MSNNDWIILMVVVGCGLLKPVVIIARVLSDGVARRHPRKYRPPRKWVVTLPSVGEFTSNNRRLWFRTFGDISVQLSKRPVKSDADRIMSLVRRLPQLADRAREFAKTQTQTQEVPGGVEKLDIIELKLHRNGTFDLVMWTPADPDADEFYRFAFRDDEPIRVVRDD